MLAGDPEAFRAIVEREGAAVLRVCRAILGSGADAEDAAQESLVSAYRALATWRGDGPFGAWLRRIAVRTAFAHLRRRRTLPWVGSRTGGDDAWRGRTTVEQFKLAPAGGTGGATDAVVWISSAGVGGEDPIEHSLRREASTEIRSALARLDGRYREVIALRFYADLSLAEIAETTGRPLGTVKTHLHRGLRVLRETLLDETTAEGRAADPGSPREAAR